MYPYAAFKGDRIVSLHNSLASAKKTVGKSGFVLHAEKDGQGNYVTHGRYSDQVFKAPRFTGYRYIVFAEDAGGGNILLDPI